MAKNQALSNPNIPPIMQSKLELYKNLRFFNEVNVSFYKVKTCCRYRLVEFINILHLYTGWRRNRIIINDYAIGIGFVRLYKLLTYLLMIFEKLV